MYRNFFKPFFDFLFAVLLLLVSLPIICILAVFLIFQNRGNPFFYQRRPGKNEKLFTIVKFKTMTNEKGENGNLLPDEERLTTLGKWIRKTSLDELPQLFNVLKGEMSFVGPRPLLPGYLPLYNDFQKKRHLVKPGITGWAQVNGRNAITWEKKFEYDVFYVQNCSFVLDLKIILKTIQKVLIQKDINTKGMATTEPFQGTN